MKIITAVVFAFLMLPVVVLPASAQVQGCVTLYCPTNVTAQCTSPDGATVNFRVSASSTCARTVSVVSVPPSGSLFGPGSTPVTCTATDDLGNSAQCVFTVNVVDTKPPVITVPAQVITNCTGPLGAVVEFTVSAVDACDPQPKVHCSPPSGSIFPIGTNLVTCISLDASTNESRAFFPVIVNGGCGEDCVKIICPRDIVTSVRSGKSRVVTFSVTATNQCGGADVSVYTQPPSGSAFPIGTTTVYCVATNVGAVQKCSFKVTVQDTTPPQLQVPRLLTTFCQGFGDDLKGGAHVLYNITATDNCDPEPVVSCTPPSGSWFSLGTNQVVCVAADDSGNRSTNSFLIVVNPGPNCEAAVPVIELAPDNWGFELGIVGWSPSGSAFAYQPVVGEVMRVRRIPELKKQMDDNIGGGYWQDLTYRIGFKGSFWIGTADNYGVPQGGLFDAEQPDETLTGELLSKTFIVEKPYLSFLIGGGNDPDNLRVELLVETDPGAAGAIPIGEKYYHIEFSATGHGRELMRRVGWGLDGFGHHVLGKHARIRIVDHSTTGHLNVDDFQFVDTHPHFQKVLVGGNEYPAVVLMDGVEYDWDSPVWGFADLHTHPMSHLGFAEKVMHGQPDGGLDMTNIAVALDDCNCSHGGYDILHNQCGNYLRQALELGTDDRGNDSHREGWNTDRITFDGTPNEFGRFRHWPVFSTKTHQQMWYEWTKRTYDGGLRVMVALCVNSALLGSASEGPGPLDDLTVGDNQIQALKEFVARHDDFMEIAYDPVQLRDIVRRNKLAVIIGTELDDVGNLVRDPNVHAFPVAGTSGLDDYSKQAVTNAIEHLYTKGVRYIFPIHLVNNKFAGTPIANLMLNIASRYLNGEALQVEPAEAIDRIHYWLPTNFDLSVMIDQHKDEIIAGAVALPAVLPLLPTIGEFFDVGLPPGSGTAVGAGLLPVALLGAVGALPGALQAIPPDVWPINNHYPVYPGRGPGEAPWGHRNARGLTPLGEFAVRQIMKHGMMIDVDHMSQKTLVSVFQMAEANPVGYPLNSGHNSFRALAGEESAENHRSNEQMDHIRNLGGLFGVGYENTDTASLSEAWIREPNFSSSHVDNDCAGTSKTVSQIYLYALETMSGHRVALGTDVNGLIAQPGPRFGPNSDFGSESPWNKPQKIRDQDNGVLYTPKHGRPLVGPVFQGKGVDPDKIMGFGSSEHLDGNQNLKPGYAYSQDQRDFFVAVRNFHFLKDKVDAGFPQVLILSELEKILQVLDDGYYEPLVSDFTMGLINGIKNWPPTSNGYGEDLGRLVYREEVLDEVIPDDVSSVPLLLEELQALRGVWQDYHRAFGGNPPLKRCQTGPKDWDINFEGVAHYGMIPDLLQDMSNVGLETADLDPLFQTAEDFAAMWTKTLQSAEAVKHPYVLLRPDPSSVNSVLEVVWFGETGDQLLQTDKLGDGAIWGPADADIQLVNYQVHAKVKLSPGAQARFFRVRK